MSEAVLDPAAFAHLLEITGDDLEFVDELVDTYFDDAVAQLETMRQAAERDDAEALVRPTHSLKSSSANIGASTLSEACRSLEADGRIGVVPDMAARVADCQRMFAEVRAALLSERASR